MMENLFYEINKKMAASQWQKVLRPKGNLIVLREIIHQGGEKTELENLE